jgi:hypothetical protein
MRAASAQALLVRRPASETGAALPADPFARRPRLRPALVHALTGSDNVVLGAMSLFVLAASAVVAIIVRAGPRPGR